MHLKCAQMRNPKGQLGLLWMSSFVHFICISISKCAQMRLGCEPFWALFCFHFEMHHFALHFEMNSTVHLECLQRSSGLPPPSFDLWIATLAAPFSLDPLAPSWVLPPLSGFAVAPLATSWVLPWPLAPLWVLPPLLPPLRGSCRGPSCPFVGLAAPSWVLPPLRWSSWPLCFDITNVMTNGRVRRGRRQVVVHYYFLRSSVLPSQPQSFKWRWLGPSPLLKDRWPLRLRRCHPLGRTHRYTPDFHFHYPEFCICGICDFYVNLCWSVLSWKSYVNLCYALICV